MQNENNKKKVSPTTIIVFGATGDLFQNKLAPALFSLFVKGALPRDFKIIGFARRPFTDATFRDLIRQGLNKKTRNYKKGLVAQFLKRISYHQGRLDVVSDYRNLGEVLIKNDRALKCCTNKLFYIATPPDLYETIFDNLSSSGLSIPCAPGFDNENLVWTRILVEKPFGSDLQTAKKLDKKLGKLFAEEQIFRIDHYLAKETTQNILSFRFSNSLFESVWNKDQVEKVELRFYEKGLIGSRGAFYDGIGALRDVGQNHLLQMLSVIAMEDPKWLRAESIRRARAKVLSSLSVWDGKLGSAFHSGQYLGYPKEKGVAKGSRTETFFKLKLALKTKRWKGVPFYLTAGKGLNEAKAEIEVFFRKPVSPLCDEISGCENFDNSIIFKIQPDEGIILKFYAKAPGFKFKLEPQTLSFKYQTDHKSVLPDAYERVLLDAILGDQTLFASTAEVMAEWRLISPILKNSANLKPRIYKVGSRPEDIGEI